MIEFTPSFVTAETVATQLGINIGRKDLKDQVLRAIRYAERTINSYCKTDLRPTEEGVVMMYNGNGTSSLTLDPLAVSISEVMLVNDDGDDAGEVTNAVLQPTRPTYGAYRTLDLRAGIWPCGLANIKLTGRWGLPEIPEDLEYATVLVVKNIMDSREVNHYLRFEMNASRQVYQLSPKDISLIPPMVEDLLDPFTVNNLELML